MSSRLKEQAYSLVSSLVRRINKEKDEEKKRKWRIIKEEFQKLADQL